MRCPGPVAVPAIGRHPQHLLECDRCIARPPLVGGSEDLLLCLLGQDGRSGGRGRRCGIGCRGGGRRGRRRGAGGTGSRGGHRPGRRGRSSQQGDLGLQVEDVLPQLDEFGAQGLHLIVVGFEQPAARNEHRQGKGHGKYGSERSHLHPGSIPEDQANGESPPELRAAGRGMPESRSAGTNAA